MKNKNLNSWVWHKKPNTINLLYSLNYYSLPQVYSYRAYLNFLEKIMTFYLFIAFVYDVLLTLDGLSSPVPAFFGLLNSYWHLQLRLKVSSSFLCEAFLAHPEELRKHKECLLTLPFTTCTPFLGTQIYFKGTLFQFQSICFMWGWLYPRA